MFVIVLYTLDLNMNLSFLDLRRPGFCRVHGPRPLRLRSLTVTMHAPHTPDQGQQPARADDMATSLPAACPIPNPKLLHVADVQGLPSLQLLS